MLLQLLSTQDGWWFVDVMLLTSSFALLFAEIIAISMVIEI